MNILSAIYDLLHKGVEVFEKFWDECTEAENIVAANRVANMNYNQANANYDLVSDVFYCALSNCAEIINAKIPLDKDKCAAVPYIQKNENGNFAYRFWFYCRRGQTSQQIQKVIQYELDQECYIRNIKNMVILSVQIHTSSRVFVEILAF